MTDPYLFPHRLTRRDFLRTSTFAAAGLAAGKVVRAQNSGTIKIGSGQQTYTLDENWGRLPEGMTYGFGCAVVVDSQDRIYVTSRSQNPCVSVWDRDGKLLETWSNDFAEKVGFDTDKVAKTAHGLYWSQEGNEAFFYFTENVAGGKGDVPKIGARVYKTDLKGKVLYTVGNVDKEDSTSQKFAFTNPTDVAVAPNGDIYVVDGYGSQRVTRFDKNFKELRTIGGKGTGTGQFNICHGIWISTLNAEPEVYIADRVNGRLEVYSLELEYKRTIKGDHVRNPCCFYQHDGKLFIPDLAALVTIIDAKDQLVATLGDGKGVKKEEAAQHPEMFFAPHALTVDSKGDFYVVEWLPYARVRKFRHTPVA